MFFSNSVRSSIASRLRLWLAEEPEMELQLGLLSSHGCAKNLVFDSSALNLLIEDSTRLEFKRMEVGEFRVRLRPWSSPSIHIEVRRLRVTLAPRETSKPQISISDLAARKKKEVIASLDPEGASLHDAIERILARDITGDRLMTSWGDVLASCSQIKFSDIAFELQIIEKTHACLLEMDDCFINSQFFQGASLFRQFLGSLFLHGKGCGLSVGFNTLRFGLKENDQINWITSLSGLSAHVKLMSFHPLSNYIHVPLIEMKLSPDVIPLLLLMLDALSSKKHGGIRTGKELWRITANKIGYLTAEARTSLHNVGEMVVLWARYVSTYNSLLTVAGRSTEVSFKENVGMDSINKNIINQARHQLGLIFELEQKLPARMVVQARKIARNKRFHPSTDPKRSVDFSNTLLRKIFVPFWFLWRVVWFIFQALSHFSFWKGLNLHCGIRRVTTLGDDQSCCISFEEVFITCSHSAHAHFPITKEVGRDAKMNLPSFGLILRQLWLNSRTDESKVSFFMALGEIKLCVVALHAHLDSKLTIKRNHSSKTVHPGSYDESKVILWSDSALLCHPQVTSNDDSLKPFGIILENNIGNLWSNLKKIRGEHEANALHDDEAFLICELKSFLTDPYNKNGGHGLWKYSLNVGKVSLDLDYSSILLAGLIFRQVEDHSQWALRAERTPTISSTSSIVVDKSRSSMEDMLEIYANEFVVAILNLIPAKNIHVGALVAGFCIRVSLEDRFLGNIEKDITHVIAQGNSCHWIKIDIGNTEFVIWPASKAVLAAMTAESYFEKIPLEYLWLVEPRKLKVHEEGTANEKFISHGCITLNAYLRLNVVNASSGFELTKQSHIAEPISITIKASICRDYYHSFYTTTDVLSLAFTAITSSAAVLFFIDELRNIFQLFEGMLLELPVLYNSIGSDDLEGSHKLVRNVRDELCSISTDDGMNLLHKLVLIDATLELESVDLILGESRKAPSTGMSMYDDSSSCNLPYLSPSPTKKETSSLDMLELPGFGLGFSIHKTCINLSLEAHSVNVLIDLSGLQAVLLDHQSLMRISNDMLQIRNIPSESLKHSYQFFLSHCMLKLHVSLHCGILCCSNSSCVMHSLHSANCRTSWVIEESRHGDGSPSNPVDGDHEFESGNLHSTGAHDQTSGLSFVVDVGFGCIIVSDYHDTSLFNRSVEPYELRISIFVGEGLHSINCKIQGGSIFLEALALTKFFRCFSIYSLLIASFPRRIVYASREASVSRLSGNNLATPDLPSSKEHLSSSLTSASSSKTQQTVRWDFIDALTIDLTQFSFTLAVASSSGKAELTIEVDVLLRLTNFGRRIIVDLHRLEAFTQHLHESILNKNEEMQVLHFSSQTSIASGSPNPSEKKIPQDPDCVSSDPFSAHSLASPTFEHEESNDTFDSFYHRHSLLKHMNGSVTMETVDLEGDRYNMEFDSNWVGKGSISGLNLIIKFSEIQMFLALYALFSETFPVQANNSDMQNVSQRNSVWSADSGYKIPDGAIIAIQDLQQHMYFAVEAVDNKYHLVGTLHYFLSGERALFKVRYHKSWRSRMPCMSFISLYAKNNKGEPLCLNFNPRSGFVGISGTDGNGSSLWQTFFHEFDNFEDEDDDVKTYATSRKAFRMVNLKNDSAVAFIDGMPEFVKKPGNQFKVKLFDGSLLVNGIAGYTFKSSSDNGCDRHLKGESSVSGGGRSEFYSNLPHVNFTLDKVTLTIVHDVSNVDDQLPLFRCCLDNIVLLVQILSTKLRILSLFSAVLHHFDARMNIWREVVAPVDLWLFYRSRFTRADSFIGDHGVPVHFFLRTSLVDISLTDISLDILLYLINKLDLAGPYAVRRSVIFPNSCKLENCTGLSVLYQFSKNQNLVLSRGQCSSVFLRSVALADRLPVRESSVSISLSDNGGISTSPINIALSNPCLFAWRTHIVSSKDSKTFPGPFVVIDVAKKDEEGLSVIVSPLLRIHNDSKFPMELCFQRPEEAKSESASILLKNGDSVDDSRAVFDALDFYGGSKRTLLSLTLGNFLLSLRPQITEFLENNEKNICFCWSEEIKGEKALRVSGIFDKLNYRFRKALGVGSLKSFFSTLCCPITIEGRHASDLHFLIQTISRDVPIMKPQNVGNAKEARSSLVAMQVQKEIFIYPTVQVYNLLQSEIFVLSSENHPDMCIMDETSNFGKQATIPSQSSAYLYANPANIYFRVTLNAYGSTSKPVNSGDWVKKLEKRQSDAHFIDIELEFGGGTYFAALRLSCSDRGLLEATIFTTYTFQNSSEITLFCSASCQISHSRDVETKISSSDILPESGCLLPPKSTKSWFLKSTKVYVKWLEEKTSMALVDLDILTAFIELSLEAADDAGINRVAKLGVSLQPCVHKEVFVPMHVVSFVPRFVIVNESKESIVVRQCYLQGDVSGDTIVEARQKVPLHIRSIASKRKEKNLFDSVFRSHSSKSEDTQIFVQFCTKEDSSQSWSGSICIASLGRFFLKFKGHSVYHTGSSNLINLQEKNSTQFAAAYIVDDRSSLILYFHMPPDIPLPYRIENFLQGASIKYYQKDSAEPEILPSGASTEYVWDDMSLPHRLVVEILDFHLMREINIDKICEWKPFFKMRRHRGLLLHLPLTKQSKIEQRTLDEPHGIDIFKLGFEVYADGSTRVLRLCESTRRIEQNVVQPSTNFQLRVSSFAVHFLKNKQVEDFSTSEPLNYVTIIVARLGNITLDSLIARRCKYNNLKVQSFTMDEKWQGAPFASMVRRSQLHDSEMNMNILHVIFILQSTNSKVKQVKYCSVVLQPIDLKIDEETLMKLVPFWRSSNNNSVKQSQQFYFKHFEIHPVKITASFLPGNQYPGYNSAQQALRSLLHSVLKVPSISNVVLELNGVLLTHALVTSRELLIKCAQHYSWYLIRAVYIAKGSSLLPPAFASIFDDTASYSLDVFFDPSDGSISLPGVTLGMFKIISKCIHAKGFSGTRRYFGDLGKTIKTAGSNVLFAAVTEISDNVLRGAESSGFNGLVTGFHQGILRLAMEPSLLGAAVMKGGPDRKIILDRSPGVDELYIEGYLQAMLDVMYKQEYLRVRVIDNQVLLKNLPPNSSVINEILENVKSFLVSNALLKGDTSASSRPLRCLKSENDWKLGPTVLTLCEHLFVSFTVRMLRKQANKFISGIKLKGRGEANLEGKTSKDGNQQKASRTWSVGKFFFSGMIAYVDGRLCRHIPHPLVRRIVSGFMLSYLDKSDAEK